MTILSLVFTAVLDTIFLNAGYPLNMRIGIVIGFIAIYLIVSRVEI
jgi:hypothetical protein